ncbi:MAG: nickel-responsive transcriptional regulator NikR [Planctomycetaceae bacterium]|nr:nickel-responsive transcriptional regulator NikR [Planctomycetaceae bacterium]
MSTIERVGVSLEKELLGQFDGLIEKLGYTNRSEAIRDIIRERLSQDHLKNPQSRAVAAVLLVYDHHSTQLADKLLKLQHDCPLQVVATTHVHLDHHNCLEVIIMRGKVREIETMAGKMTSLRGVKLGRLNIVGTDV